ncbi:MAG: VOC family protein [Betaproteobacteria bacterium]|nr:VOC family protein [Betaproteobacteria bacterium]
MAIIDHLVVAATELEAGARWLEAHLGVRLSPGGAHHAMGTHNRLLKLGPQFFLEIIAIDPAAAAPARPRWFALESRQMQARLAERPRLIHWVARSTGIVAESAACPEPLGPPMTMRRGNFEWLITVPDDGHLPGDGLVPTLIEWRVPQHPADGLPDTGCSLMKLEGFHPEPARIRDALTRLGLNQALAPHPTVPGEAPALLAYLKTPLGLREMD